MNREQLSDKIIQVTEAVFEVDNGTITESDTPQTLESWDSLAHVNLIAALEQELGIIYTPEEQIDMFTIEIVIDIAMEKMAS